MRAPDSFDVHVVSHTHWDREWYLTFQQFRLRLVDLIDHVLAILEGLADEYREERYRAAPALRRLVAEGRLGAPTDAGFHPREP